MERKPNVILINCDDMGYGDLGCYGSVKNHTPAIDALAREGVRFTSFYAASPVCSPSRAALMTGCYPPRVGITRVLFPGEPYGLDPAEYTMPKLFQEAGYATMIVGKWHCGDQLESLPKRFGFDDYYGLPYSNDMGMQRRKDPDFPPMPPLPLLSGDEVIEQQPDQEGLTERYVEQCIRFLRRNKDTPFFLYFAQMHVHLPLYAAHHFAAASENGDFGACMASVDWSVAALVAELKRLGIYEDTLLIFTSDNGSLAANGASNAPLRGTKHTVWEGGLRVPFIVHWKGHAKEGAVVKNMACNIDLLPTFAALLGKELPGDRPIDGVSVLPMLLGEDKPLREEMCYFQGKNLAALRRGRYKLHRTAKGEPNPALFDLEEDVSEQVNLRGQEPELAEELEKRARELAACLGDECAGVEGREVRPCLRVESPKPLTEYDENHPYIVALYDKSEAG